MDAMNTMFENNALDMIALESAITFFEVENDITADYLASDYSRDAAAGFVAGATEGACDDDDFFASLFNDTPVVSAATEGSGESLGAKIGNTVKKIIGAIKGFFAKLAEKFKSKKGNVESTLEKAKGATLSTAEENIYNEARDVRAAASKLIGILNVSYRTESAQIKKICTNVEKAIKKTASAGYTLQRNNEGDNRKERAEKLDHNRKTGIEFGKQMSNVTGSGRGVDEAGRQENTKAELQMANTALDHMKKVFEDVKAAYEIVKEKANAFYRKGYANEQKKNVDEEAKDMRLMNDLGTPEQRISEENAEKVKAFEEKRKAEMSTKNKSTSASIAANVDKILTKAFYAHEANLIRNMLDVVDGVVDVCTEQVDACDLIMKATDAIKDDGPYAKIAYESCKIYKEASTVYNGLSLYLNECINCGFFNTTASAKKAAKNEAAVNAIN